MSIVRCMSIDCGYPVPHYHTETDAPPPTADPMERVKELAHKQSAEWQRLLLTLPAGTRAHQLATAAFYIEAEWTRGRP